MASVAKCGWGDILNRLTDELLQEILCRLPSSKSAVQSKSVCKRLAALVSAPFFIGRFIADKKKKQIHEFCILLVTNYRTRCLAMKLRGPLLNPKELYEFSLEDEINSTTHFDVLASCNDLMIVSRPSDCCNDLYIRNVQTNQRVPLPARHFYDHQRIRCVITCDRDRCSVVVIPDTDSYVMVIKAHLFSNAKWREIQLSFPKLVRTLANTPAFVFEGKLYFDCIQRITGFDPYDEDGNNSGIFKCDLVGTPCDALSTFRHFQEYRGQLHMFVISRIKSVVQMWRLKDYKASEWLMLRKVITPEWIIRNGQLSGCAEIMRFIGAHPTNPDWVYLLINGWIVVCDLSNNTFEIASHVNGTCAYCRIYSSILPIWPTPILPLISPLFD